MGKAISEKELRRLYEEVEPLFPKDTVLTTPGMSGNDRMFLNNGFRIGLNCVMVNEKDPELLDVGLWCNYPNYHMLPSKEGITRQNAKDWLIDSAKFAIEREKEEKISSSKKRKNQAIALMLFSAFTLYLAIINGPTNFALIIKIIAFYVGTILIGPMIGMGLMWLLHLATNIPIGNSRYESFVDGVWKGDNEELGVAKARSRITNVSLAVGIITAGICLYVGLFTEFPLSFIGVYLFVTTSSI